MSRYMCLSIHEEDDESMEKIMAALSSKVRRDILRLVDEQSYNISEIAQKLEIPLSNAAFHVKHLQEAGMVNVQEKPASRGMTKIISRKIDEIVIKCTVPQDVSTTTNTQLSIPIGSFTDCKAVPTCGMASAENMIGVDDTPGIFFSPERVNAQIIWLAEGYLEYKIPNYYLMNEEPTELVFSMELCSEVSNYRNDWTSDITFWVNGRELCTWTSPGDFGGRRGRLNPQWWSDVSTQYGLLKTVRVNDHGVYMDEHKKSSVKISELHLEEGDYFTLRIGIKPDAENVGGLNIFGEKFGDYEQGINVRIEHKMKREE
ncbi:MAG: helix-turn-helix domain-containing protein [Tyzzerella sp.]|nr:helix-turn-helix domain-containing protein [Tyzzerella sp.]